MRKAVSSDGNDSFLLFRGVGVSRSLFQAPAGSEGGGQGQYTYTSELACDRGGFEGGRGARLRRPVLGDRGAGWPTEVAAPVGRECSCRDHDGALTDCLQR